MYRCIIKVKKSMDFLVGVGKTRSTLCGSIKSVNLLPQDSVVPKRKNQFQSKFAQANTKG